MTQDQFEKQLKLFEGNAEHFYLDTVGEVTIGTGLLFKKVEEVFQKKIKFTQKTGFKTATEQEIKDEFKIVKSSIKGQKLKYYEKLTNLRANSGQLALEFRLRLRFATLEAKKYYENDILRDSEAIYKQFSDLPEDVQYALIDMSFNLGYKKLSKFTTLRANLRKGKWQDAAEQSHRRGIPFGRNKKIFDWIDQYK